MKRVAGVVLAVMTTASVPSVARAQSAPAGCKTTTTVECTGEAAPLAVPFVEPAPPPLQPAPPLPPSPQMNPYLWTPPARRLPGGWRYAVDEGGNLVLERKRSVASPGMIAGGVTALTVSCLGLGLSSTVRGSRMGLGFVPIVGGFIEGMVALGRGRSSGEAFAWSMGTIIEFAGIIVASVGSGARTKIERMPVQFGFGAMPGGGGATLSGRF